MSKHYKISNLTKIFNFDRIFRLSRKNFQFSLKYFNFYTNFQFLQKINYHTIPIFRKNPLFTSSTFSNFHKKKSNFQQKIQFTRKIFIFSEKVSHIRNFTKKFNFNPKFAIFTQTYKKLQI